MATDMKVISVTIDTNQGSSGSTALERLRTEVMNQISDAPDFSGGFEIVAVIPKQAGSNRAGYEIWVEKL
jgi:hypothetical protein